MDNILVTSPLLPDLDEFQEMLKDIWKSKWITNNGSFHQQLEKALAEYLKVPYVSLFTNGTLPLITALQALHVSGEAITTPYSFVATTHSLWWNGIKPVFVDIDWATGCIDPNKVESAITPRTTAIMPVHVYGKPCDTKAIQDIADKYGLRVIYDAAHAFGVEVDGQSLLNAGDISTLSFHATKVYNTVEGGAVCTDRHGLRERLRQWRNFGITGPETVEYPGGNAKMDELRAAMGLCNLRHVRDEIARRGAVHGRYVERLSGVPGLALPVRQPGVERNYAYFPVLLDPAEFGATRDDVFAALAAAGINARKYFYPLVSDYGCYRGRWDSAETPVARRAAARVLTLPIYAGLAKEDVDRACDVVLACVGGAA